MRGVAVGGGDDHLGGRHRAVGEFHPGRTVSRARALGQDLRHACVVTDLAAELEVAALEVARHRQGSAQRVSGVAGVQPRHGHEQRHRAHRAPA